MPSHSSKLKILIMGDAKNAQDAFNQARSAAEVTSQAMVTSFAAASAAFGLVGGAALKTSAEFEKFRTQLDTIEGSSSRAAASMDWITKFTKNTPFELKQVTDAFVQMKAFGLDPIANDSLRVLGDTSAAMGRTLDQGVQALADAVTGEFERLKEFGIKARTVGNQVQFSYQQNGQAMVATADKTSQDMIQATLLGIFNDKYAGGMDKLSQTWGGMTSNMSDSWTIFQKQIGDAGAFDAAKGSLAIIMDEMNKNDTAVRQLAQDISGGLITGMEVATTGAALFAKGFIALGTVADGVAVVLDGVALTAVQGFDKMLSGLMQFYGALANLPGSLGEPYAQARKDIVAFRHDLAGTTSAIAATGSGALDKLGQSVGDAALEFDNIDQKAVKFFTVMEKARNAGAASSLSPTAPQAPTATSTATNTQSPEVTKALSDAQKIIDIHSAKWQKIQTMGQAAFGSEQELMLAKAQAEDAQLVAEQQRIEAAAQQQGAGMEQIQALRDYYDQLRIDRAQQTADQLAQIDAETAAAQQRVEKQAASARLDLASNAMGALSGMLANGGKKAFEASKALSIAQTVISTYSAAQKAYESQMAIPTPDAPARAAVAAGVAIAQGVARAAAIASTSYGSRSVSSRAGGATTPGGIASQRGFSGSRQPTTFNPGYVQSPNAYRNTGQPTIQVVQHINAPGATAGTAQQIQQAAALGAQQAVAHVANDFQTNGPLRQSLAV